MVKTNDISRLYVCKEMYGIRLISLLLVTIVGVKILVVSGQQQYFRVRPRKTESAEGDNAELQCHIANLAGAVQWSKNGFVLGFDPAIPGYPRYSMIVDQRRGVYNLKIRDVRLEDEGDYQCQVGPAPFNNPIWAQARLTVLVPPSDLFLYHHSKKQEVSVTEAERYTISCIANDSKPASQLKWYRNGVPIRKGIVPTEQKILDNKLYTTVSDVLLYAILDDNGAVYTCEARHPALRSPLRSELTINVLYPPGIPEIEGYNDDDVIQEGDTLSLACICRGGNPTAVLHWYRDDVRVDDTYTANSKEATNVYTFTVAASDNNSMYRCDALSTVAGHSRSAEVKLTVIEINAIFYYPLPKEASVYYGARRQMWNVPKFTVPV